MLGYAARASQHNMGEWILATLEFQMDFPNPFDGVGNLPPALYLILVLLRVVGLLLMAFLQGIASKLGERLVDDEGGD